MGVQHRHPGTQNYTPTPVAPGPSYEEWLAAQQSAPPSGTMATDPEVLKAYQDYMSYSNQADVDTSSLRRNLLDAIQMSKKKRASTILGNNINFSDRGLLDSGIALKQMENVNTEFDTNERDLTNTTDTSLSRIARRKLDLLQGYENSKVAASGRQAKAKAEADAAAYAAQQEARAKQAEIDQLLASLHAPEQAAPVISEPTYSAPAYSAPAPVYRAPVYKPPVRKPVVKSPIPVMRRVGPF